MVGPLAPSARALAIWALLAVSMKLSLGSEVCIDDAPSVKLLQRTSREVASRRNSSSKIVFIKTHFTGGTTTTGILQRYCDWQNATCARRRLHGYDGSTLTRKELPDFVKSYSAKDGLDIWPWHVEYDRKSFEELIPGALIVSLFREPISRVISGWSHDHTDHTQLLLLLHLLKTNGTLPSDMISRCSLPMSRQVPKLSDVDLVMLTEDYDLSLVLLARRLGWSLESLLYTVDRVSLHNASYEKHLDEFKEFLSQPPENMTETGRNYMRTCLQADFEMYEGAKKRFRRQLDVMSHKQLAEVQRDVARFQAANQILQDCCARRPSDLFCKYTEERPRDWHHRTQHAKPPPSGTQDADCRRNALSRLKD